MEERAAAQRAPAPVADNKNIFLVLLCYFFIAWLQGLKNSLAPFPGIAVHVEKAQIIGLEHSSRMTPGIRIEVVPRIYAGKHFSSAIRKICDRPSAAGI